MKNRIEILKDGTLGRKKEKKLYFPKGRIVDEKAERVKKKIRPSSGSQASKIEKNAGSATEEKSSFTS